MFGRKKNKRKPRSSPKAKPRREATGPAAAEPSRMRLFGQSLRRRHGKKARRGALIALAAVSVAGAVVLGMHAMERHVLARRPAGPAEFRLRLTGRPEWMPQSLARRLVTELTPPGSGLQDRDLPEKVYRAAQANPWIRSVTWVRRRRGSDPNVATIELQAEYRKPIACVQTARGREYISADGCHLPRDQVPRWVTRVRRADGSQRQVCFVDSQAVPPGVHAKPIHYIKISGVKQPPPGYGRKWPGRDLAAGARMAALVANRPYANQIVVADVRNCAGRMLQQGEPHLRYYAQIGRGETTDIRFGRFPQPGGDHNVLTERKLSYIDSYVARHKGRLAGLHTYIDLRFDELHVSVY